MHIIKEESSIFELLIESLDDLWILSQFINPEDIVYSKTERKVKIGSDISYKVVRKTIFVELLVKQVKFESEILRILGEIQNETEFTSVGANQSLNFKLGDKIEIKKKNLLKYEKKLIENSSKSKKTHNLLVMVDRDEIIVVEFSEVNFRVLFNEKNLGSKKRENIVVNEEEQKYKLIEDVLKKDYANIIFSGPGLFKDKLQKYVKDKDGIKSVSFHYVDVAQNSIERVIKKIYESNVLGDLQLLKEGTYISKLLENISKGSKYIYSKDETYNKINEGSIEVLLISTKFIEKSKDENHYVELNSMMKLCEDLNGELVILNSNHEAGKIIDGLGGIGGILRY